MGTLTISLLTKTGDELGRLRLEDVAALPAGASAGTPVREQLELEMDDLCAAVEAAIESENLALLLDALGLRLAISRALLLAEGLGVVLPVPVAPISAVRHDEAVGDDGFRRERDVSEAADTAAPVFPDIDWNALFEPLVEEVAE